ncbi:MAG TPA: hypothetical protein PLQ13_01455 [Candidatus Krumholzibacteria bacterium]|nr:hypothetical protein [Candidatus Krumholzibacteria bacterium]
MKPDRSRGPGPRLQVHPHREGPWLVVLGRRRLAVPPELGRRVLDLAGGRPGAHELAERLGVTPAVAAALLDDGGNACGSGRGPRLRVPLVPAARVRAVARRLSWLAAWPVLGALAAAGGVAAWVIGPASVPAAPSRAAALLAVLVGIVLHELGHAAALVRGGYPPGGIGLGLVTVVPVFWCDVSAVALLPRRDRLRVDLAGPAVQAGAAAVFALAARWACVEPPAWTAAAVHASLAVAAASLVPILRADGFWFLSDLAGVGPLDRLPRVGDGRRALVPLAAWQLARAGSLGLAAGSLASRSAGADGPLRTVGPLAAAALGTLAALGLVRFGRALRRIGA